MFMVATQKLKNAAMTDDGAKKMAGNTDDIHPRPQHR